MAWSNLQTVKVYITPTTSAEEIDAQILQWEAENAESLAQTCFHPEFGMPYLMKTIRGQVTVAAQWIDDGSRKCTNVSTCKHPIIEDPSGTQSGSEFGDVTIEVHYSPSLHQL